VESEQEIIDAISDLHEQGADFIKISLGPVLDPRNHQALTGTFSSSQASQIVIYADSHGMRARFTVVDEQFVMRAIGSQAAVIDFVPAFHSLDSLINSTNRHPNIFVYTFEIPSQAAIIDAARSKVIQMAESGAVMVPMITIMDREFPWVRPASGNPQLPPRSMYEEVVEFFADRGGRVALGSGFQPGDTPGMPMAEVRALQRSGMTNLEMITAITYHSALACGAEGEVGTLTVGKRGDVIILDNNVLDDITALERPTHVFLDGKQVFGQ
jgi:imidazolonepropionase-like amidohydrolase